MALLTANLVRTRVRPLAIALAACAILAFAWHMQLGLFSDVVYFITMDQKILAGAWPYRDIVEANPPLIFALMMPPVWLADVTGLAATPVFIAYVIALTAAMIALAARVRPAREGDVTLPVLCLVLLLLPGPAFGKSEHFLAILAVPYLCTVVARAEGRAVALSLALAAGAAGGIGLALKPYFLLIPIAAELGLMVKRRSIEAAFRPEACAAAGLVLLYPLAVLWLTPEYFSIIVPLAAQTYSALEVPLATILAGSPLFPIAAALIGVTALIVWQARAQNTAAVFLCLAAAGSLLVFVVQMKGWYYQAYPALAFATAAFLVAVITNRQPLGAEGRMILRIAVFATGGLLAANLYLAQTVWAEEEARIRDTLDGALAGETPKRILTLTHLLHVPFPYIEQRGLEYAGNFPSLWMMPATVTGAMGAEERKRVTDYAADLVARTIEAEKPGHIIVDRMEESRVGGRDLYYVSLFAPYPRFAAAWSSYEKVKDGPLEVWRRNSP